MDILLTGGSGFIGKNILEQLGSKYNFFAPSHSELDLLDEDSVKAFFNRHKVDAVIHAANVGGNAKQKNIPDVTQKNLDMFANLAAQKNKFKKFIFLGSGAEYDKRQDLHLVREEDFGKNVPVDDYGVAKYKISEQIKGLENFINLRCFAVYGKYEDADMRFISNAITKVLRAQPITIYQNVFFDFVWVGDLVKVIDYFLNHTAKEKFYNFSSGQPVDLISLAEMVKKITGKTDAEIIVQQQGLAKEYSGSNQKLLQEIPDLKLKSLEEGIVQLAECLKANK